MSDLNPDDRALLDLAREGHEPTDSDRGRVRIALVLRLGVGTGLAGTTAATSKAATAFAITKVLAAVAIAGAIGGAGAAAYRATKPARQPIVAAFGKRVLERNALAPAPSAAQSSLALPVSSSVASTPSPVSTAPTGAPASMPKGGSRVNESPAARVVPQASPLIEPATAHVASPASAVAAVPVPDFPLAATQETGSVPMAAIAPIEATSLNAPAAVPPPTTLEAETRLVRAGVAALHGGDAARALALFDEHARTFPDGALAEERAAERVIALSSLHRCAQARFAAAEFVRDHPHSPLAARVREPCVPASNP